MKRIIAMLLCACMLLTALPAALAETDAAALPAVGDVVYGFEAKQIREFPLIDAQAVLFEHQKTGARLMYIANDDVNRVYDLTFFTDAIDKTGLPHVFEHSTLDGSDKYPSKALFFNLIYQTYNTYMNAFTTDRMTSYPVASLSEAQLLKYADYYTDSCLHPMIMTDESIFREEAWRYRLADADSPLTIEGTVYSEMLGAMTLAATASINNLATAFPGSTIGNEYGGEPAYIPDMTWEMLQDYHNRYYHPSNMVAFLYGDFEDYTAFLKLLDEAISGFEKREFTREDAGYTPLTEPVEASYPYPVEAGSSTEHQAIAYYTLVCAGADLREQLVLNTLTDLMIADASPVQQALQQALPYGSFGSFIETGSPDPAIVFSAQNINVEDAQIFRETIDAALAGIAAEGFPQDMVDGVMASLSVQTKLMRESSDVGVENIIPNVAYSYAVSGDPWNYMDYIDALSVMDEWNQQGLYAKAVSDWLLDNPATALVTTFPEPGLKEQNDAAEAERLAAVKAAMSDEEIAAIVAASNAEEEEDDGAAGYVAQLQAVTVESLPEDIKLYEVHDETDAAGVRHIDVPAGVDGIGQVSLFLDAMGLPLEDLHWLNLYAALTGELDTHAHTKSELALLKERYLNSPSFYISMPDDPENGYGLYLRMGWIGADDDLAMGYDLMKELFFDLKVEDTEKVQDALKGIKARLKNSINSAPYNAMIYRAFGAANEKWRLYAYVNLLEYYAFLEQVEAQLAEDPAAVVAALQGVCAKLDNNANAVAVFAGNEESIALNRPLADAFMAGLQNAPVERQAYDVPAPATAEGLVIDNSVQFNGVVADYESLGLEGYDASLDAVTALVLDTFLYPLLRDQYGAYSVMHGALEDAGVYVVSYRDPNVAETFDVYEQLSELVGGLTDVDQETLDGYILSAYAAYAMPQGELSGAVNAALLTLEGRAQDEVLDYMRQLKSVTPETFTKYAELYAKLVENGVIFTAGPASAIEANAERYEAVLNPFGAKDASQVELTDVPEDHPLYEAVRFAFENGLMKPVAEDAFGVDEPATNGDLLAAMHALAVGPAEPEEALAFFAGYGLVPGDIDLSEPMDPADIDALASALLGEEVVLTEGQETLTRGEFAVIMQSFVESLG